MSSPKKKDRNRQGSSGRPEDQIGPSGEDLKGENWKVAGPKPQDPNQGKKE